MLDPRAHIHLPIGVPDSLDALKTFVEPEGCFSPGFATWGVYVWLWQERSRTLHAATDGRVVCHGLEPEGVLVPWSCWDAGGLRVRLVLGQARVPVAGELSHVVAARISLTSADVEARKCRLYLALRPLGPAGGAVHRLEVGTEPAALLADGHTALVSPQPVAGAMVFPTDSVGAMAEAGAGGNDQARVAVSPTGECSGALFYDVTLGPGGRQDIAVLCPVLAGRYAVRHHWDGCSGWAQLDRAVPGDPAKGARQPDPGPGAFRQLDPDHVIAAATGLWRQFAAGLSLDLPDVRWTEALRAILGHVAMAMNEGAPDVAVANYNVFNRDGVYTTNILQKAGVWDLAAAAIDYFLRHPFNGRVRVEADNPGQILWVMGEHWRLTRDRAWLGRVVPSALELAALIRYCRTGPGPHWVQASSLEFGERLPPDRPDAPPAQLRQVLEPGSCDGYHPEYTDAFDIAGLRAAAELARAAGETDAANGYEADATQFVAAYRARFGEDPGKGYGSYCVLWPCRLFPRSDSTVAKRFRGLAAFHSRDWRYFPLATAHQALLAGDRDVAWQTVRNHLDHPQMRGWYVLDEGGKSGAGGWHHARTTWDGSVAMPHGWAVAELWLLIRDCLAFEDEGRLVLLAGVPPAWFAADRPLCIAGLPTTFGRLTLSYRRDGAIGRLALSGAEPPEGFVLPLPAARSGAATVDGQPTRVSPEGEVRLPPGTRRLELQFALHHP